MPSIEMSRVLFESFLRNVVVRHVFSDSERARVAGPITDKDRAKIREGRRIDDRVPYLMTVSGKGGYVAGQNFASRAPYRNITLIDHVLSVARGAALFAEIDLRGAGDTDGLEQRLALLIATGFLHDADKMLGLSRQEMLDPSHVETVMDRYGVGAWLETKGVRTSAADLLLMIEAVEMTRGDMFRPGMRLLSVREKGDAAYVRLADRLDGLFLDSRKDVSAIIKEIENFGGFRSEAPKAGWRSIHMRAPHTPFILSNFQVGLSKAVQDAHGMPPLLEMHHDGEFLAIIPAKDADAVIENGITDALGMLSLEMRVDINPKGTRDLLDGAGDARDLIATLQESSADSAKALFIHRDHLEGPQSLRAEIDALTAQFDFMGDFGGLEKFAGKHYQPWSSRTAVDGDRAALLHHAAALAVGLGCAEPVEKHLAKAVPDAGVREGELVTLLGKHGIEVPAWLLDVSKLSRQTLLAILAAGHAKNDPDIEDDLFGRDGLLNLWLQGDGAERAGLVDKIGDPGAALTAAAKDWLRSLIDGKFRAVEEDFAEGRCHFTNMPVGLDDRIDGKSGIDGLKVSAFSGREGRPESFTSTKSQTLVSPVAFAEHRLRTLQSEGVGFGTVPAYISSPSMMGLFASLNLQKDRDFLQINQFDLMRLEEKNGKKPWPVTDTYGHRIFFARHFSLPEKQIEIVAMIRMMLRSSLRMGRPVHVFRGLPVPNPAFFHIDAAPDVILRAIGGNSLRLEQIRPAIETLEIIEQLADINGIGLEVAMRFADPETRFAASCEALVGLTRLTEEKQKQTIGLRLRLQDITREMEATMSGTDDAIIAYALAMTGIQEAPRREASNSIKTTGMRLALEAIEGCINGVHQTSREAMIAAIVGKLQDEFERSTRLNWIGRGRGNPFPSVRANEVAALFVDRVWTEAFLRRAPASKTRRIAMAIYQVTFENEHRRQTEERFAARAEAEKAKAAAAALDDDRETETL